MGGFGSAQGMITSLKNNSRKAKREAFSHLSGKSDQESQGIESVPVSDEALEAIRTKLKKQRKNLFIKRVVGFILFTALAILLLIIL